MVVNNGIQCPTSNGTSFTTSNGAILKIECTTDHCGRDYESRKVVSYENCLEMCSKNSPCKAVSFDLNTNICYLKSSVSKGSEDSGVWSAILESRGSGHGQQPPTTTATGRPSASGLPIGGVLGDITCPRDNKQTRTSPSGNQYIIECGVDRVYGDIAGRGPAWVDSFDGCLAACDSVDVCQDVSWNAAYPSANKPCYLKEYVDQPQQNKNVWGARRADGSSGGSGSTLSNKQSSSTSSASATASASNSASISVGTTTNHQWPGDYAQGYLQSHFFDAFSSKNY
ncbi:SERTA domain-containing protein 3 [Botryosphaeria dothidea]